MVYVGGEAVPGAPEHLRAVRRAGMRLAFITNNAARTPQVVAEHLTALGVEARTEDVVTSAQAAAHLVVERHGAGVPVVCLGGPGLEAALREEGLCPVGVDDDAEAVVTGYGPDVLWRDIMRVAVRIREGLPWVASNTDTTIPTPFGVAPGHGVLVDTLRRFSGVEPAVAGKPQRPLLDETVRRVGGRRPLMVGDRLDTDIEGAQRAGVPALLVLTGVTGLPELVDAPPALRPTYLSTDLGGLLVPHAAPQRLADDGNGWRAGGWVAAVRDGALAVTGEGHPRRLVAGRRRGGVGAPGRHRLDRGHDRGGGARAAGPRCRSLAAMTDEPVTADAVERSGFEPTGIASIDEVLDRVAGLDERPLEEHAAVFETAHAELRRTLDDPPDGSA
ncbi:HAD hydrolase-like protein [Nocardioides sp. TF02-7]|uniref:HAD-IIA family hydrolase n=1 Tax=Nocardioides sp. TF02-7 TaxID=2917724 RepID=UPI001F05F340|nr:HAD hydrolase-like protein [Nocardioides sp. TF02-7]UMG92588.1 HAD hydrolase-like protein [Nocardioides sp. TF02-7]